MDSCASDLSTIIWISTIVIGVSMIGRKFSQKTAKYHIANAFFTDSLDAPCPVQLTKPFFQSLRLESLQRIHSDRLRSLPNHSAPWAGFLERLSWPGFVEEKTKKKSWRRFRALEMSGF